MKRIVICCILAALILLGGIFGLVGTLKVGDDIKDGLKRITAAYESGDTETAKAAADEVAEKWRNFRKLHILITDNDHALEITMAAARIKQLLELGDDEVKVECGIMEELISDYCREQEVRAGNIF